MGNYQGLKKEETRNEYGKDIHYTSWPVGKIPKEFPRSIRKDQIDCMGCLSQCKFSNWSDNEKHTTGKKVDPRSFCIQKTLQDIVHDKGTENQLMFAGHNAWRFSQDPFYSNGFVPTVKQLVDRILSGA